MRAGRREPEKEGDKSRLQSNCEKEVASQLQTIIMNGADFNEMQKMKQIEEMKKKILATILSKDAYERLARVRVANQELAGQAELYLLQIYQAGKLEGRITDEQMKEVLRVLSSGSKQDFNIRRK
ncbi:MAG: hypothetical protein NTY20_05775 [Candidatus Aenigmarchaeota archaeon]|nr:hypothetical protein [Candidatus Aenigmarchaeota archaeon]